MKNKTFKVLIVDDEPEILDLLNYHFSGKGLDVYLAGNGREALEKISQAIPDIILLDIMMPVVNGIQFCEMIRAKEEYKNIPVLFLSATGDDLLILSALTAGGGQFASKPIRFNILYDMLVDMVEKNNKAVA